MACTFFDPHVSKAGVVLIPFANLDQGPQVTVHSLSQEDLASQRTSPRALKTHNGREELRRILGEILASELEMSSSSGSWSSPTRLHGSLATFAPRVLESEADESGRSLLVRRGSAERPASSVPRSPSPLWSPVSSKETAVRPEPPRTPPRSPVERRCGPLGHVRTTPQRTRFRDVHHARMMATV